MLKYPYMYLHRTGETEMYTILWALKLVGTSATTIHNLINWKNIYHFNTFQKNAKTLDGIRFLNVRNSCRSGS